MTINQGDGQPVLELTGIGKEFGAIRALHDVDLHVRPGEVVGLMGDNGAGKSTLVKMIAGNFRPTHGEIRFDGNAVHFSRPVDARGVGIESRAADAGVSENGRGADLDVRTVPDAGASVVRPANRLG